MTEQTITSDLSLREFLLNEMQKRDMSARQFANFIGVSHGTINKFLEYGRKDVGYPSVEFIEKLAIATNTPLSTIMGLILPHLSMRDDSDPRTELIYKQIQQLSEAERKLIFAAIRGLLAEREK